MYRRCEVGRHVRLWKDPEAGLCAWTAAGERVGLRDVERDQITQGSDYMDFIPS